MSVAAFNRTLDQELAAIARGASFECLVCGEFLLHGRGGVIACPECGLLLQPEGLEGVGTGRESASIG
jgi:predicted RNA-binding Zn-ribbon protein involved in translation (DUF1610 family)